MFVNAPSAVSPESLQPLGDVKQCLFIELIILINYRLIVNYYYNLNVFKFKFHQKLSIYALYMAYNTGNLARKVVEALKLEAELHQIEEQLNILETEAREKQRAVTGRGIVYASLQCFNELLIIRSQNKIAKSKFRRSR